MTSGISQVIPLTTMISVLAAAFFVTRTLTLIFIPILTEAGFVRPNYKGELIPLGTGIVFYISLAIVIGGSKLIGFVDQGVYLFLFSAAFMAIFGLIDDIFGSRNATGLTGHFKKMITKGQITTGALKALAGFFAAVIVSMELSPGNGVFNVQTITNVFIVALSINAVNLLDLRPGRAGKGFLILSLFLAAAGIENPGMTYLSVILASVAAFIPFDLGSRVMMGDAGSNTLGFILGYAALYLPEWPYKAVYLIFLVGLHLLTEKYSLTRIIENNKILNYIDMIGRR